MSDTSSFADLCLTLLKREQELVERPRRCDVCAAAAGASVGRRRSRSGRNSLEPNAVKVRVSMLRQSLSILKQLSSASKWVLLDSPQVTTFKMHLKKKCLHNVILLWCLTSDYEIKISLSLTERTSLIEGEILGLICASSGLRKCHTQLLFFLNCKCRIRECRQLVHSRCFLFEVKQVIFGWLWEIP